MADQLLNIFACLGTCLKSLDLLLVCVFVCHRLVDLAALHVFLISDEEQFDAFIAFAGHVVHPPIDTAKALIVANRVGKADGCGAAVEY